MHDDSWASEVPEAVAEHLSSRVRCEVLLDGFSGSGSCAIKFANTCIRVLVIDINPDKLDWEVMLLK